MRITKLQLKKIISEEVDALVESDQNINEGVEQLTPENIELLFNVMKKMATEPAIVSALGAGGMLAAIEQIKGRIKASLGSEITEPTTTSEPAGIEQEVTMMAKAQAFLDTWISKLTSRKLMVWLTATGLTLAGHVTSEDWVIISAIYIGGQTVIDGISRLRGYNGQNPIAGVCAQELESDINCIAQSCCYYEKST